MPLVAAALCPHPPMLLPEIAGGAAAELAPLRAACDQAVDALVAAEPEEIIYIGAGPEPSGAEVGQPDLPLSLAIGVWLLRRAPSLVLRRGTSVSPHSPIEEYTAFGQRLAASRTRSALLVMGDGSACRGPKSPGYDDARARPFDEAVAAALATADAAGLRALDRTLAGELMCAGWAPWQVLAAAVGADGRRWHGDLGYDAAPYGVAYFVASWLPALSSMNGESRNGES